MSAALISQTVISEDVRLAQQGDQAAFGRLILQTQNTISSIALAIVRDLDASEDVAQTAYIAAWQQLTELKNPNSFLPWLRQITRNLAKNFLRDNKVQQRATSEEAETLLEQYCDPGDELEVKFERQQISQLVGDFVSQLPAENRELVLLYYREQQNSAQVARLLGLSETNVRKQLSRVRASLKQDILVSYGKLLLSTVPAVTFGSAVVTGLSMSSPVAAATLASTMASSKTSFLGKLAALLGGAMIGSLMGVLAVFISSKIVIRKLNDQNAKQAVKTYRNYMIGWMLFSGMMLALAYEFTVGWWAPVATYLLFAAGLAKYMVNLSKVIDQHIGQDAAPPWRKTVSRLCNTFGTALGLVAGFAGLMIGLVNSGRLVL